MLRSIQLAPVKMQKYITLSLSKLISVKSHMQGWHQKSAISFIKYIVFNSHSYQQSQSPGGTWSRRSSSHSSRSTRSASSLRTVRRRVKPQELERLNHSLHPSPSHPTQHPTYMAWETILPVKMIMAYLWVVIQVLYFAYNFCVVTIKNEYTV